MAKVGYFDAFGFQSSEDFCKKFNKAAGLDKLPKNALPKEIKDGIEGILNNVNTVKNLSQIAGYIPVVGTICAIVKYFFFRAIPAGLEALADKCPSAKKEIMAGAKIFETEFNRGMNDRIFIELFSVGFILIVTDYICTKGNTKAKEA